MQRYAGGVAHGETCTSPRAFGATPFLRKGVGNAEARRFSSPFACEGGLRGMAFDLYFCNANAPPGTTAIVRRAMQVRSPASLSMRISHTCVLRPTWIGRAVAVTSPSRTARRWLALI